MKRRKRRKTKLDDTTKITTEVTEILKEKNFFSDHVMMNKIIVSKSKVII